ncbi:MAG TPA: universal stress protein [Burkholderiales bacterium]|nr:universal stress protein [Burkholderiales bacterium]
MKHILVPIGTYDDPRWAAEQAITRYRRDPAHIHLLNVQRPLPQHVSRFFGGGDLRNFHRDEGMKVLEPVIRMLDEAGVPHRDHVRVGNPAKTIVEFSERNQCAEVVLQNQSDSLLAIFGLGSIGSQVRHLMEANAAAARASEASGTT